MDTTEIRASHIGSEYRQSEPFMSFQTNEAVISVLDNCVVNSSEEIA